MERCDHKSRNTRKDQKPEDAGKTFPWNLQRELALPTPFRLLAFQATREQISIV